MEVSKQQRMQTIDALLNGYSSLSVAKLLEPLAPDFHHQVFPESLGMPIRNKDSFAEHAAGIFDTFEEFRMTPRTIIDDATAGLIAIDAEMLGTLKGSKQEWNNECIMIVRLTEDDCQVLEVREFVDSAKAVEMAQTHAPKDFGTKTSGNLNIEEQGLFDLVSLIYVGTAVIACFSLYRMLYK
ncbi:hypothetical protein F5B22DRAFT_657591 [Xylaria bambusicola]|uniref:uncharacterized protein n=1 Tax=Xylaria bambusicola TaxID=326684 RepID=UPI002007C358|nr:uncharacterized protein F5B22DRAFT_657591 [Xylaria bambusicola]KAI0512735.1 hypothetical protein F5B22DRAFT_657591 [Xylaria bambusicola]